LLGLLQPRDYERLRPHLQRIPLEYRQSLYRAHKPIGFVYFIETGVGSLVNTMANGEAAEVGTIGNEGMVGLPLVLGDDRAPTSVYVQVPGAGLRMKATLFTKELAQSAASLYSRILQPGRAIRCVQSLSYHTAAMLPVAADDARPHAIGRVSAHAGVFGHDAGGAADWCHGCGGRPTTGRSHPL
jgi:CRP-like cAMP-binding protein